MNDDMQIKQSKVGQREAVRLRKATREQKHLEELQALGYSRDSLKPIRVLESRAHAAAEKYANGEIEEKQYNEVVSIITDRVARLFGTIKPPKGFFINGDPRGYALKLDPNATDKMPVSFTDWGGYGILAPAKEEL